MARVGGILLAVILLAAVVGAGLYMLNSGMIGNLFRGNVGDPLVVYGDNGSGISYGTSIDVYEDDTTWEPDYVAVSAGQWMQNDRYGWKTFGDWIETIDAEGATPVVLWYYWGNDTTQAKITASNGTKSVAEWYNMTSTIADTLNDIRGEREAIVVLEPEFNKHGVENWTEFNSHLISAIDILHKHPNIKVAIGFGNWDNDKWANFAPAVEEADMVGYNAIARTPKQYETVVDDSIAASQYLHETFPDKPIILYDFGASSAPEPDNYGAQQAVIVELFEKEETLREAGTSVVIYKNFRDQVQYVPMSERYWGLVEEDGQRKPAYQSWMDGVTTR